MDYSFYQTNSVEEILKKLGTARSGLSAQEAAQRTKKYGLNEITTHKVGWVAILMRQSKSPFIVLLFCAALLSLYLGNIIEGSMILGFVLVNALLGFYYEYKAEHSLLVLRGYLICQAKVLRANVKQVIDSKDLVVGDIIILVPGDILPADIRIIETDDLYLDESLLTGESVPVQKTESSLAQPTKELFKATNIGMCGTNVVSGDAVGIVIAIGNQTAMGSISTLVALTERESNFAREIATFSKFILVLIVVTLLLVLIINLIIKHGQIDTTALIIFTIALAVAVIPEPLPLVITFGLSRAAVALAKKNIIVKRLSALEDLGSINLLCTDKTGTLTENRLTVSNLYTQTNNEEQLLLYAVITAADAIDSKHDKTINPFDTAVTTALEQRVQTAPAYKKLYSIPFDHTRLRNTAVAQIDGQTVVVTRGAFEAVYAHCKPLAQAQYEQLQAWIATEELQGKRVLVIAAQPVNANADIHALATNEHDLQFSGAVSFDDPIKVSTFKAVMRAKELGVIIKILTGDSPQVAGYVASKIGLIADAQQVITGAALAQLPLEQQKKALLDYAVFARVLPEQKFFIVNALREDYTVGYLGDGVNDAPALKIADVAIVVRGATDIAREAADIIMLKKDLYAIIVGIFNGRTVFANTVKFIKITLAANFGTFYTLAVISIFIPFLPLLPLQILLSNFIDALPMISCATDLVSFQEVARPNKYDPREIIVMCLLFGIISSLADLAFFYFFTGSPAGVLQTGWFIEGTIGELVLIYSLRTRGPFYKAERPSAALLVLSLFAFVVTIALPQMAIGQRLFKFVPLSGMQLFGIGCIILAYFIVNEIAKFLYYGYRKRSLVAS